MINILHSQIKHLEEINFEKDLLIKQLKEQIEIKNRIINLQDTKIN
jgi:hypothetical protein